MDDVYIFLSFVAIVLSPCFVALHSRARGDQEEEMQRRRKPQMHPVKTLPNRRVKPRPAAVSPSLHRLAPVAVAYQPKEAAPGVSRSRRPNPGSVFIAPVRRIVGSPAGRTRHSQSTTPTPAVAKRRQPGGLGVWIRPVRRALTASAINPNQLCRLCRAQIFGNDHEQKVSPRLLFKR